MIICDDPAFLFVHVPKSAGTSISGAFAHLDLMRRAKRRHKDPDAQATWLEARGYSARLLDLPIHASAVGVKEIIGEDKFNSLYSFAVVRNPWDMELSWYTYNTQVTSAPHFKILQQYTDFTDYVCRHLDAYGRLLASRPQTKYVFDKTGQQIVDKVLRYESLADGFNEVVSCLGLTNILLDHFNQSYHEPWTDSYTPQTFELVRNLSLVDCEAFDYAREATDYGID
ncbi:MAG: sulfotransferase family 2 domain-containing protein [Rhodospirillaceae bacterium]